MLLIYSKVFSDNVVCSLRANVKFFTVQRLIIKCVFYFK